MTVSFMTHDYLSLLQSDRIADKQEHLYNLQSNSPCANSNALGGSTCPFPSQCYSALSGNTTLGGNTNSIYSTTAAPYPQGRHELECVVQERSELESNSPHSPTIRNALAEGRPPSGNASPAPAYTAQSPGQHGPLAPLPKDGDASPPH